MTAHSEDRAWWFDGEGWHPAVTPDGRRWSDGRRWRPNGVRLAVPVLVTGATLLCLWPVAFLVLYVGLASHPEHPGRGEGPAVRLLHEGIRWWSVAAAGVLVAEAVLTLRDIASPAHLSRVLPNHLRRCAPQTTVGQGPGPPASGSMTTGSPSSLGRELPSGRTG